MCIIFADLFWTYIPSLSAFCRLQPPHPLLPHPLLPHPRASHGAEAAGHYQGRPIWACSDCLMSHVSPQRSIPCPASTLSSRAASTTRSSVSRLLCLRPLCLSSTHQCLTPAFLWGPGLPIQWLPAGDSSPAACQTAARRTRC